MKVANLTLSLLVICSSGISTFAQAAWTAQQPETVTLFSRTRYKELDGGYGRSAFSFKQGLRSDSDIKVTHNNFDLVYGNLNLEGDSDWFLVTMVTDDRSRIKDLGELEWSNIFDVPILEAAPEPHKGMGMDFKSKNFAESSDWQLAKVKVGHIYVVHSKDAISEGYALFLVDELVPNDRVSISWKTVPSPEVPINR